MFYEVGPFSYHRPQNVEEVEWVRRFELDRTQNCYVITIGVSQNVGLGGSRTFCSAHSSNNVNTLQCTMLQAQIWAQENKHSYRFGCKTNGYKIVTFLYVVYLFLLLLIGRIRHSAYIWLGLIRTHYYYYYYYYLFVRITYFCKACRMIWITIWSSPRALARCNSVTAFSFTS